MISQSANDDLNWIPLAPLTPLTAEKLEFYEVKKFRSNLDSFGSHDPTDLGKAWVLNVCADVSVTVEINLNMLINRDATLG